GRERGERHVDPRPDRNDVVRAQPDVEPRAAVEERVRQVEQVASTGVEVPAAEPVGDGGERREPDAGEHSAVEPRRHAAPATAIRSSPRGRDVPTTNTATRAAPKAIG